MPSIRKSTSAESSLNVTIDDSKFTKALSFIEALSEIILNTPPSFFNSKSVETSFSFALCNYTEALVPSTLLIVTLGVEAPSICKTLPGLLVFMPILSVPASTNNI